MTRPHGRRRVAFYGCMRYDKRGVHVCRNGLQIRQDVLDQAVLDILAGALDADVIAAALRGAVAELRAAEGDHAARRASITRELETIAGRERRLLDALADGDMAASAIRDRLREELARRDALTAELATVDTSAAAVDVDQLMRDVASRTADLRGLLGRHVAQARQIVRLLLDGRLVCTPFDDARGRGYTFAAMGTYRQLGVRSLEVVNGGRSPLGPPFRESPFEEV